VGGRPELVRTPLSREEERRALLVEITEERGERELGYGRGEERQGSMGMADSLRQRCDGERTVTLTEEDDERRRQGEARKAAAKVPLLLLLLLLLSSE
jgi:hypothetical protein